MHARPAGSIDTSTTGRACAAPTGCQTAGSDERHLDLIAQAVCELLGTKAKPRLSARLREARHVLDDADDICQLAALAFLEAYRAGRIAPDPEAGEHTARSVAAYAWGICNRIFCDLVRRKRPEVLELLEGDVSVVDNREDPDQRLWEVLGSVAGRCRPEDIVMAYLLASGASVSVVKQVMGVSRNTPANALRRVGEELRRELGLEDSR